MSNENVLKSINNSKNEIKYWNEIFIYIYSKMN